MDPRITKKGMTVLRALVKLRKTRLAPDGSSLTLQVVPGGVTARCNVCSWKVCAGPHGYLIGNRDSDYDLCFGCYFSSDISSRKGINEEWTTLF